ncbi:MAG: folate-binding protein [Burkholderiaceae bacterium]
MTEVNTNSAPQSGNTGNAGNTDNTDNNNYLAPLLAACQNRLSVDPHGPQATPLSADPAPWSPDYLAAVPALSLIRVHGPDAAIFLQGQLTNDVEHLAQGQCQWSGLCSPKGRLLASFLVIRETNQADAYQLLISRELAASTSKRLTMYVLRAKAKVEDLSNGHLLIGVQGASAAASLEKAGLQPPDILFTSGSSRIVIRLEDVVISGATAPRYLVAAGVDLLAETWNQLSESLVQRPSSWWRASEIISGVAHITPAIREAFVPQMINYEIIGGVDFDKGCYTGQEVVARSQYLGKMKRRMFLATSTAVPGPGDEVTDENARSIGTVVASGPSEAVAANDTSVVLFESQVEHGSSAMTGGMPLAVIGLPYEIPEPKPFVRPV